MVSSLFTVDSTLVDVEIINRAYIQQIQEESDLRAALKLDEFVCNKL